MYYVSLCACTVAGDVLKVIASVAPPMRLALIGVGQAGGKITDAFLDYDIQHGSNIISAAIAVNTATVDLQGLDTLPEDNRTLIGEAEVNGHGVGADNELGAEVARNNTDELSRVLDSIPIHTVDAFLVIGALGGGTGSGGAPVIANHLTGLFDKPVYGLGILPGTDEGSIYTLNAARSFQTFVREVDNLIVFDNDAWRQSNESFSGAYETINTEIVTQLTAIFGAGELGDGSQVGESVVDASEIINTLNTGGVSTIGYACDTIEGANTSSGLLSQFRRSSAPTPDETDVLNRITSLIRKSVRGRLTLPCNIASTERALAVVTGPPEYLSRKGIEKARTWVEDETECMEVRGGDDPHPGADYVAGTVLLSGVTDVPRIKQLQQVAIEAQGRADELAAQRDDDLDDLISNDNADIDPLF